MGESVRVSVVTPFYNTDAHLSECIESVLAQTHSNFEYLLVNNQSSDSSREIAARYSGRDARIRLIDNEKFVGQVENYNGALAQIAPDAKYVKMVQADDALFADCLRLMVEVAERDPRIGLVGSFYLKGADPAGAGLPHETWRMAGRDVCRMILLDGRFPLGSPTAVMYRAALVRARAPFFSLGRYHEDTEAAFEILLEHDFGFVHQICSFLRTGGASIMSAAARFDPGRLDHLITMERYGRRALSPAEFERQSSLEWRAYQGVLGESVLAGRGREFWDYHRRGLATIGHKLGTFALIWWTLRSAVRLALNPLSTLRGLTDLRALRGR